jgi:hypothetical protein
MWHKHSVPLYQQDLAIPTRKQRTYGGVALQPGVNRLGYDNSGEVIMKSISAVTCDLITKSDEFPTRLLSDDLSPAHCINLSVGSHGVS